MHSDNVPPAVYEIAGKRWVKDAPGFAEAIADAFEKRLRPRCLCRENPDGQGIEMYVAHFMDRYIVKRMPYTGSHHDINCLSYELPASLTGRGQLLGSAIVEDPATGNTSLRLGFSLTKMPGRSQLPLAGSENEMVANNSTKLSLRGLLHYLWDQAELTRWKPGFAGKRTWATVRKYVLQAAEHTIVNRGLLRSRLYIPEVFSVDQREAINDRLMTHWSQSIASPGMQQHLVLLIAEVKEIVPARYSYKAVLKHVPDHAFVLNEQMYRSIGNRFSAELALWGASDKLRLVMIATFNLSNAAIPTIFDLSLMLVTSQWLPVENANEHQLLDRLVRDGRAFNKGLRYNLSRKSAVANAILVDTHPSPVALFVGTRGPEDEEMQVMLRTMSLTSQAPIWVWQADRSSMPALPERAMPSATS